jgi:hypothetical protein
MSEDSLYHAESRKLQDQFDTLRLAWKTFPEFKDVLPAGDPARLENGKA